MTTNFLEQLVAEWFEYQNYFIRRGVRVGKRSLGGYDGELEVVAFRAAPRRIVHIETSTDGDSWAKREERLERKFATGRKHIPALFKGYSVQSNEIEQLGIFVFGSTKGQSNVGNAKVQIICRSS